MGIGGESDALPRPFTVDGTTRWEWGVMAERYTRADVAGILANVNGAAARLGMRGAGSYAVETMGGTYLYLTNREGLDDGHTGPGSQLLPLGKGWHSAGDALITFVQALHVVEMMREG